MHHASQPTDVWHRGHSIIELLIVIAIILLVMTLVAGAFVKVYHVIESWQ